MMHHAWFHKIHCSERSLGAAGHGYRYSPSCIHSTTNEYSFKHNDGYLFVSFTGITLINTHIYIYIYVCVCICVCVCQCVSVLFIIW